MSVNYVGAALAFLIIIVCGRALYTSEMFQLKCVISKIDGNEYCVRERAKLTQAADRLASVNVKMQQVVDHCKRKYPNKDIVRRLVDGYNPEKIIETLPTSKYTAYSENKGEKLAFCLNTNKETGEIIDENTLTFVALHEISHIATKSVGHTPEFWNNFKFFLNEAVDINVYVPVDYKKNNKKYCGTVITDNPYYDI